MSHLPLTSFEHYMYADDRPSHPMTFFLRMTVAGAVDEARLRAAAAAALRRHPLLAATIDGPRAAPVSRLRWRIEGPAAALAPFVDFGAEGAPLSYPAGSGGGIDLTREPGLRLFVRRGARESTLVLQLHHAVSDGLGGARFLEDLLALYAAPDGGGALRPLSAETLARRHELPRRARVWRDLARILRFFGAFPRRLATDAIAPRPFDPTGYPASVRRDVPIPARPAGATVNDVLLRDLFVTLDAANRARGRRRPLRVAMAIDMRRGGGEALPAANVVSMCFLDRGGAALDDPAKLLASIARETTAIKAHGLGSALLRVTDRLGRLPRGLVWLATPRRPWRCSASAVLSNLGAPLDRSLLPRDDEGRLVAGDLVVTRLELLPPVRPETLAAVGVVTYAGRTTLTVHYDQTLVTAAEAASWMPTSAPDAAGREAAAKRSSLPPRSREHRLPAR